MKKPFLTPLQGLMLPLLFLLFLQSTSAQNANNFSSYLPYSGKFSYGVNPGYYGGNWNVHSLATIAMGSSQSGLKGAGVKSFRVPIYDDYISQWGLASELADFQYYASLSAGEITAFIGSPSAAHQFDTTFSGSPEPSKVFKGLYEPVWLDGAKTQINPNNYFAKYLYDVVKTYGQYVKFWEVVNEPDFTYSSAGWSGDSNPAGSDSWFYHNPNASELVNLRAPIFYYIRELRVAWEVIKQLSPQSYICTGGIGYRSFLDALLRNTDNPVDGSVNSEYPLKAGAYFDVLSFHSYPEYSLKRWDNTLGQMVYSRHSDAAVSAALNLKAAFDQVLGTYGYNGANYPKKQYIVTETALSRVMDGEDWGSNEGQKNYLVKALIAFQQNDIRQCYWYQLGDGATTNQFDRMGLYYYFGSNTVYNQIALSDEGIALKTTSDLLYGAAYDPAQTSLLGLPTGVKGAAFRGQDGSYTYALWAATTTDMQETAAASYSFPQALASSTMQRMEWDYSTTGAAASVSAQNIALSATPSFFSGGVISPAAATIHIEAENYQSMHDVQTEATRDSGGGKDVGYINPGSWMNYRVNTSQAGMYTIRFRVATPALNARFELRDSAGKTIAPVLIPTTGDWQRWQTITLSVSLPQGAQTLQLFSTAAQWNSWNINWLEILPQSTMMHAAALIVPLQVNPAVTSGSFILSVNNALSGMMEVQIMDPSGTVDRDYQLTKDNTGSSQNYLAIDDLAAGIYTIRVIMGSWTSTTQITRQ